MTDLVDTDGCRWCVGRLRASLSNIHQRKDPRILPFRVAVA